MNGNVLGNKTSQSRQAFRAYIRYFPFTSGQPKLNQLYTKQYEVTLTYQVRLFTGKVYLFYANPKYTFTHILYNGKRDLSR